MPASLKFPQFLQRYAIQLLYVSEERIVPASLLDKQRQGYVYQGHLRNHLPGNASKWSTEMGKASIVYGTVERELSLSGKASAAELGLTISGGLNKASSITYTLRDVRVKVPVNTDPIRLVGDINDLRHSNKAEWRKLNGLWVAERTFHVAAFDVKINVAGGGNLGVDLVEHVEVSGKAEVIWKNKKEFTVTNDDAVPFGFTGFRI